ncbi:MAG: CARDB domain-containing protein [Desulfocapsaceae bacterium]|nr:CARDB domain-containing protein [Desulfocapsaceae bacterium]
MDNNHSKHHPEHLRLFQLSWAAIILAGCLLITSLLLPVCSARAADSAFLPAVYHLLLSNKVGWENRSLSHPIPLTYNDHDQELRQCRSVQVEDGYWIAYTHYAITNVERRLFIVKTNLEGRTMIPPFQLTTVTRSDDAASYYRFALVPREEGGVQVLATKWDEVSTNNPAILYDYVLDRQGKITSAGPVMTEGTSYNSDQFHSLWAAHTADGRTVFAAISSGALLYGVYTNGSDARVWEVAPDTFNPDYFNAYYDTALNRLYLMYSHYYSATNSTYMTRWTLDGTREIQQDLSGQIGSVSDMYSYQLMPTPKGLLVSLPNYVSTYRFFLMNPDCTIKQQVAVNGLVVNTPSRGHMVTLDNTDVVRVAWRGTGTHPILNYAAFNLDGKLLISPMRINQESSDVAMHPNVFVDANRTTLFYSVDYAPDGGYRRLFCRHMAFDFPAGQPDLVVSAPHIIQSPGIASLGDEIWLLVRVFNRGDANSAAASVTLTYNGATFSGSIGQLAPGEYQEVTFSGLITPAYLTAMPILKVSAANGYWDGNNSIESLVRYPNSTPVYPVSADHYTWTVENRVTHDPLPYALASILVPNMLTVDGKRHDIVLFNETDSNGEFSFRLPDGTYTFHLSKYGYASDNPQITVPGAPSTLTLDPPGDLTVSMTDTVDGTLHPTPNRVELTLEEQTGSRLYTGRGDENGLTLKEIMPATYNYTITAFGYPQAQGSITIHGGANSLGPIALTPTARGVITGHVSSGASALASVNVSIQGTDLAATTDGSGNFSISDLPYSGYTFSFDKDNYQSKQATFILSSAALNIGTVDLPAIPPSTEGDPDLGNWTHAAWNRIDSFPGFLDAPSYKITTTYGTFDFQGSMIYSVSGEAADFSSISLNISGRKWYYYSVSTEFSLLDIAFSNLGTSGEIADAAGQVAGFLVDPVGGFLDSFLLNVGMGGSGGQTIVRVDRVALYDGTSVLWDSPMLSRQEYSTDGPMDYALSGAHTDQIQNITLKVYLTVMNENYSPGPLVYMDKFRFDWRFGGGSFKLQNIVQNPADYPTLTP